MCRLFGYVAPHSSTVEDVLGDDQMHRFRAMARLHRDGWGTAWIHELSGADAQVKVERHAGSALDDPRFTNAITSHHARARLLHLRLASVGRAMKVQNSHPFSADGMAFMHNGSIVPKTGLVDLVNPSLRKDIVGTTDSELYFHIIRSRTHAGLAPAIAVRSAVQTLSKKFPLASLNSLLLTPDELILTHVSSSTPVPVEEFSFDECHIPESELPTGHLDGYYQMWQHKNSDGSIVFSSSGLDLTDWEPVAPDTITTVNVHTGRVTVVPANLPISANLTEAELDEITKRSKQQLSA